MSDWYPGIYDGEPGLVWYSTVTSTAGADLKTGDWLDSLDHSGARRIARITERDGGQRRVWFGVGDDPDDTEIVDAGVAYSVVDPDSQCAPDSVAS